MRGEKKKFDWYFIFLKFVLPAEIGQSFGSITPDISGKVPYLDGYTSIHLNSQSDLMLVGGNRRRPFLFSFRDIYWLIITSPLFNRLLISWETYLWACRWLAYGLVKIEIFGRLSNWHFSEFFLASFAEVWCSSMALVDVIKSCLDSIRQVIRFSLIFSFCDRVEFRERLCSSKSSFTICSFLDMLHSAVSSKRNRTVSVIALAPICKSWFDLQHEIHKLEFLKDIACAS